MRSIFLLPICGLLLAGCVTQSTQPSFTNPISPSPSVETNSDIRLDSLKGGVVGQFSELKLDKSARQQALAAEYNALERIDPDQTLTWTDAAQDISGSVVPLQPYRVGQQNCRAYTHTIIQAGKSFSGRGTACRNENGSWDFLS